MRMQYGSAAARVRRPSPEPRAQSLERRTTNYEPRDFLTQPPTKPTSVDIQQETAVGSCWESTGVGQAVTSPKSDVLQGTLDLMVLKTLETLGAMHGYGIAQR